MTVFDKLNWRAGTPVVVLNAPESFAPELALIPSVSHTLRNASEITFLLSFVTTEKQVEQCASHLDLLATDATLWFAFPKLSSKRMASEVSRDRGWQALRDRGFDTVRVIAIDEDWSALRFRQQRFIQR